MADLPLETLSDHFSDELKGWELVSGVFLTYRFDPAFFEQEILPAFLDIALSHAPVVKLAQLEAKLRSLGGALAVYYDAGGLQGDGANGPIGSAKLDVRRIPVHWKTGVFHPKNVLLLLEALEPDKTGRRPRKLVVSCLSANLTRAGWWENVEVCHTESLEEDSKSIIKAELKDLLQQLKSYDAADGHLAVQEIQAFLRAVPQGANRSWEGRLRPQFWDGRRSLVDFIEEASGVGFQGGLLEIISPYFDGDGGLKPLQDLKDRFQPDEVRVYLPLKDDGTALCTREVYESLRAIGDSTWAKLPKDMLSMGEATDKRRFVHAKVYHWLLKNPKREIFFIGSANLTRAAHQYSGGNQETGFLVETDKPGEPWLLGAASKPEAFEDRKETEGTGDHQVPIDIRYDWSSRKCEAAWRGDSTPPALALEGLSGPLALLKGLKAGDWVDLERSSGLKIEEMEAALKQSSILRIVEGANGPAYILVQEEGMEKKPSLVLNLEVTDILRYWSLLNAEQRNDFIEAHAEGLAGVAGGAELLAKARKHATTNSFFDRFAGYFHAFSCLESSVREAIERGALKEADYRLFGEKYDSLGHLLAKVEAADGISDDVERYVILLSAKQMVEVLVSDQDEKVSSYLKARKVGLRELKTRFGFFGGLRERLVASDPLAMAAFLDWFEPRFLRREAPLEAEND